MKIISAKILCNLLKRLDSDERIQGNPSFSNMSKQGFRIENATRPRQSKRSHRAKAKRLTARQNLAHALDQLPLFDGELGALA
jgi:hypothetical protein